MANPLGSSFAYRAGANGNFLYQQWVGPTVTFTQFNQDGTVASTRPLTAQETAELAAQDTTNTLAANAATINANLQANLTTITNWIAANPSGATLTAAQTLVVAKMLRGLTLLLLQQYASTTGT